eukprot:TRINITY_DN1289_c0_g1_i2.p1 TRINITY_DN1289_c0_g1~~TRINITY_DN1289_c0_g1_i2.p1  ORF type:complete len:244 (+),score=27.64 TRINITY_DN1289_c0_g1_i2:419-1150(+)
MLFNLSVVEAHVLNNTITATEMFQYYGLLNEYLFRVMSQIVYYNQEDLSRQIQSLLYLNWYLEWLGQERATIGRAFTIKSLGNVTEFCNRYFSIQQSQKLFYLQISRCSSTITNTIQFIESNTEFITTLSTINSSRNIIINALSSNVSLDYSPTDWWNNMTYLIDSYFYKTNPVILNNIQNSVSYYKSKVEVGLVIGLLGAIFEIFASVQLIMVSLPAFKQTFFSFHLTSSRTKSGHSDRPAT